MIISDAVSWTVDRLGQGDPVITVITLLIAIAAAHAGNQFAGFLKNRWSNRRAHH